MVMVSRHVLLFVYHFFQLFSFHILFNSLGFARFMPHSEQTNIINKWMNPSFEALKGKVGRKNDPERDIHRKPSSLVGARFNPESLCRNEVWSICMCERTRKPLNLRMRVPFLERN